MAANTSPPVSLKSWLEQVNADPKIPQEFKHGGQAQLKLSNTSFSSGSGITHTESLHLRTIFYGYRGLGPLRNLMMDDPETGYTGYVSAENHATANSIFNAKKPLWDSYFKELRLRPHDAKKSSAELAAQALHGLAVPSQPLGPPKECGTFRLVLYWQLLSLTTDVNATLTDEEFQEMSPISKSGLAPDPKSAEKPTPLTSNRPMTPFKCMVHGPTEQDTPIPGFPDTPQAVNYYPARGGKSNKPCLDESYVNTAIIELFHAIRLDVGGEFSRLDWLSKRLALNLMVEALTKNPKTGEMDTSIQQLVEARLDGYLCRRSSAFDKSLNTEPLAILEAKPFTRSSALASIRRQEGAEMACWISQAGNSETGLLRSSTSGRKRRLLVSQDRHEIYLIVAEYGSGYEEHIRPLSSSVPSSSEHQRKLDQPGTSTTAASAQVHSLSASIDPQAIHRDPNILLGSPSYLRRAHRKSIKVAAGPRSRDAQPTQAAPETRKSSRTAKACQWVPDAGDFLIMHEFGPFITTDPIHMEVLIKRLIAFFLELRGPQDGLPIQRPGPDFLIQSGQDEPSTPNGSTQLPVRTLKKSRSWPGQVERSVEDWVVVSEKAKWRG